MPDPNKHAALSAAGFAVARTCSNCRFWTTQQINGAPLRWGRCRQIRYDHAKHTDKDAPVGTPSTGTCPKHRFDQAEVTYAMGDVYAARYMPEDED